MGQYSVRYAELQNQATELQNIGKSFTSLESKLSSIASKMDARDKNMSALRAQIRNEAKATAALANQMSAGGVTLADVVEIYLSAEKQNANMVQDTSDKSMLSWLWDSAKKAGYIGATLSFIDGIVNGAQKKDGVKFAKTAFAVWKSIKGVAKDIKNMGMAKRILHPDTITTSWIKKIFGFTDYFSKSTGTASVASSWLTKFNNNFQKAGVKEISKVSWAGVAVSGIFNAISNKGEYDRGEISAPRAVAETVVETAVDVTVDIVVTSTVAAAVGATAVALGATVAAPAVFVAAGVIGVKMGLDSVAKWATGGEKGFTEAVSDGIIDGATAIGKGVANAAKKIGDGISAFTNSITSKWKLGFGF